MTEHCSHRPPCPPGTDPGPCFPHCQHEPRCSRSEPRFCYGDNSPYVSHLASAFRSHALHPVFSAERMGFVGLAARLREHLGMTRR